MSLLNVVTSWALGVRRENGVYDGDLVDAPATGLPVKSSILAAIGIPANTTVAAFPTTGNYLDRLAVLTQIDAGNAPGLYRWTSGDAWSFLIGLGGGGSGGGITSSSHGHTASGALSVPRVAGDQKTLVSIEADATSWGDNLTTTLDNVYSVLVGSGTTTFTVDLTNELSGVDEVFIVHPDTIMELDVVKAGSTLAAKWSYINEGSIPDAAWTVTWTDGDTQANNGTGATGNNVAFGAGLLVAVGDSPIAAWDDGSAEQPVIRVKPNNHTTASEARANNSYIDFPLTGTNIDVAEVRFQIAKGGPSNDRGYELRSSADAYATSLGTGLAEGTSPTYDDEVVDVSGVPATTDLSFRLYIYSPSSGSVVNIDNFTVEAA